MTAQDVVNAILGVTSNKEVREAMLLGSRLESGWNQNAVGDQGTSFGPFQMHIGGALTAAGGTPADAENPVWAAQHMEAAYQQGVNGVSQSTWGSNPELAAEEAAVIAERPAQSYFASQGTTAVNNAWAATQNALRGVVSSGGSPGGGSSGGGSSGGSSGGGTGQATLTSIFGGGPFPGGSWDPLNWGFNLGTDAENAILGQLTKVGKKLEADLWAKLKPLAIRLGLILLGVVIVYAGITGLLKENAGPTQLVVQSGKSAAGRVKSSGLLGQSW